MIASGYLPEKPFAVYGLSFQVSAGRDGKEAPKKPAKPDLLQG
jgi:hypothetical protein